MKQSKKDRIHQEILQAAKWIVHNEGHGALTVRRLAESTGYSHTHLYYYFKDLNDLQWSLRLSMIEDMVDALASDPVSNPDPVEEVIEVFFRYMDYFFINPNVFRFFYFCTFISPEVDVRYRELEQRLQSLWQSTFSRAIREGVIDSADLELTAKTIIYALQGMLLLHMSANGNATQEQCKVELKQLIRYILK